MNVIFPFAVLGALLTISDSSFGDKVKKNEDNDHLFEHNTISLTGSDVAKLMQKLTEDSLSATIVAKPHSAPTVIHPPHHKPVYDQIDGPLVREMLQEVQDRDKETRKMLEELVDNKPKVKRRRRNICRGDVCEEIPTTPTPTPTTGRQIEGEMESTTATSQGSTDSTEKPTTVLSRTSPSTLEQFVDETTTTTPNHSTDADNIGTTASTDASTTWSTTQSARTNSSILAPTPPPEREVVIPFVTNSGRCFNENCPRKPFVYVPGNSGMPGAPGERGDRGDRGPKGEQGEPGLAGEEGRRGPNGPIGDVGVPGIPGMIGARGVVGPKGTRGWKGEQGQKGEMGEDSTTETRTIYTRWGARYCPRTAELLYEGYAAGAAYDQKGGGTSYLCLPRDPVFNQYRHGVDTWRGYLYGSEYEENDFPPLAGKDDGDVPCAVCLVTDRSVVIMQPARTDCPEGWTQEYFGYLMASPYVYYRSEWTCVDGNATLVSLESLQNSDGALFYPTEVCCGNAHTGLPCDLYPNGYELTCSVCSR